jgi:hypothetical protein
LKVIVESFKTSPELVQPLGSSSHSSYCNKALSSFVITVNVISAFNCFASPEFVKFILKSFKIPVSSPLSNHLNETDGIVLSRIKLQLKTQLFAHTGSLASISYSIIQ